MKKTSATIFGAALALTLCTATPSFSQMSAPSAAPASEPLGFARSDTTFYFAEGNANTQIHHDLKRGIRALKKNKFEKADSIFKNLDEQVAHLEESQISSHSVSYYRGVAQYGLGNQDEAAQLFKDASLSSYDYEVYEAQAALGAMYIFMGRADEAEQILVRLKTEMTSCTSFCENRGRMNKAIKRLEITLTESV